MRQLFTNPLFAVMRLDNLGLSDAEKQSFAFFLCCRKHMVIDVFLSFSASISIDMNIGAKRGELDASEKFLFDCHFASAATVVAQ